MAVNSDITCVIERPDIQEISEAVRAELSKRLLGGAPVLPLSSEDILSFVMAGTVNLMYGFISQSLKENDPLTMCCDNLVKYASRRGINLQGATRSKGYLAITGTPNTTIPLNIRFYGESSREYKLDPGVNFNPFTLNDSGGAVLRVVATIAGSVFNVVPGTMLTVGTTVPGIDIDATVVGNGLIGGTNTEDCESLRRRVIAAEVQDVIVVNEQWYLRETLRYPGVTRACTDACQGCCDPTFIAIYPFMEGVYGDDYKDPPYGIPPCDVLDQMSDWMFGRELGRGQGLAPLGVRGRYEAALPATMDITARCFAACPIGAEDRIRDAVWEYLRFHHCVGSMLCKDQIRATIYKSLGPAPCMSNIEFHFSEGSVRFEDDANVYLNCGFFAVMGEIFLEAHPK